MTAKHRGHTRRELRVVEGLDDVVVGPRREPADAVGLVYAPSLDGLQQKLNVLLKEIQPGVQVDVVDAIANAAIVHGIFRARPDNWLTLVLCADT